MKSFIIPVDIYNKDVMVCLGNLEFLYEELDKFEFDESEIKKVKDEIKESIVGYGYTISCENGANVIWIDDSLHAGQIVNVLNHEIYHATQAIYRSISVYPSMANEECYAYLHEYLFRQAMEKLGYTIAADPNPKNS